MGNERDSYPVVDPDSKSYSILCRAIPIYRFAFFCRERRSAFPT